MQVFWSGFLGNNGRQTKEIAPVSSEEIAGNFNFCDGTRILMKCHVSRSSSIFFQNNSAFPDGFFFMKNR